MTDSEKEKIKLLATGMNTLAVNTSVVGTVTPLVAYLYKISAAPSLDRLMPTCLIWPLCGLVLHLFARVVLKGLDP